MIVIFACRRYRLRDIALIRLGVARAGHRLWIMLLPFAAPLIMLAAVVRLLGVGIHLVISDKFRGDTLLARLFGPRSTRMLWNYADEWPAAGTRLPHHRVCFFTERGRSIDSFVFAPQPIERPAATRRTPRRPIVFVGDVTVNLPLPRGAEWWRERFENLRGVHGYTFYLQPDYERLITQELTQAADQRLARVLAKNLLRLWIVQTGRAQYGDNLVLLGSNWRRFGLAAKSSIYTEAGRLEYYRSAIVNLDCGSKSGDSALYPRSSELISFAGGLLQVRCADSETVFGQRGHEFCFDSDATLRTCIDARLSESDEIRMERDDWLADHLREQRLLMQHSIDRVLERPRRFRSTTTSISD